MKFSLRELLMLMLAVGLGLGWWIEHTRSRIAIEQARQQAAKSEVQLAVLSEQLGRLGLVADVNDHFVAIQGITTEVRDKFLEHHLSLDEKRSFTIGLDTDDAWASEAKLFRRHKAGRMQP
jgi:hypothetical protein